ncbi:Rqc2 family fibronectin-binding protein [Geoalkalibacter halelectricus]|uniref:Rqc2 homolog RqcH n=1 Tax=Geoalkalibacter halelectricus TaxID=2847045 RepID=A0ABY5ZRA9_9BACT|nr:NFACT family protein [Geoalkalibacter halelectricus]MDO3380076.1 NFACT family protein [Geoalkalibacter halelectricus]UWZ80405.1 NFACT family protein [Geoalkalibacter halelectricus]
MDILMIEAVVAELQAKIAGARIDKIFQPEADILILRVWNGRENLRLLISVAPRSPRIHLSTQSFPNPPAPPRFCQLLRARLDRITEVRLVENERIVQLSCRGGDGQDYLLVVELLGRRSNVALVDAAGTIVDVWRRDKEAPGERPLLPGQAYRLPPQRPLMPLAELKALPTELREPKATAQWLFRQVTPMSSFVARDLAASLEAGAALVNQIEELLARRREQRYAPVVGRLEGKPFVSPFALTALALEGAREFSSPSQATEYFHALVLGDSADVGEQRALLQLVNRRETRAARRLERILAESEEQKEVEGLRETGELLLANLFRIKKGMHAVTVEDYYTEPPQKRSITLDPQLTPSENAERYFRRYKKTKRAEEHIARRLSETRQELAWLADVRHALEQAVEPADIAVIRAELEDAGLLGTTRRIEKRQLPDLRERVRSTLSPGGYQLYWGRNNRTNDYVTRALAAARDWWFHAKDIPGCHLVLKARPGEDEIPEEDLRHAAALAAGYSRAAECAKVEVMVARAADVRKPKGAPPGQVSVRSFRTLLVSPKKIPE